MAVLIEANSVIVRLDAIIEKYPGGWAAFVRDVPNGTLCSDGEIARVGFMDPRDSESYIRKLQSHGIDPVRAIVLAVQGSGFTARCDWAEYGLAVSESGDKVAVVQLKGTKRDRIYYPEGWTYEDSLTRQIALSGSEDESKLRFLRSENGVDVYFSEKFGKEVYIRRS